MFTILFNPINPLNATNVYVGVRSRAESNIEAHPISNDGVPRLFFPRNLIITYRFTEQPISDVEITSVRGNNGLMLEVTDKISINIDGTIEDINTKSYKTAFIIMRISALELNGTQRFSKSENLQLLMSIRGTINEYMPKKNVRKSAGGGPSEGRALTAAVTKEVIKYISMTVKRDPSLIILMISFFIRKLSRDFDSRFNVKVIPTLENVLILLSIFIVCTLIVVSNGETKGTYFVAGKKFLFEDRAKRIVDRRKYKTRPKKFIG